MLDIGLKVEVEPIQGDITEGTKGFGAILLRAKGLPHQLRAILGILFRLEAALAVRGSADRKKNCFVLLLACRDVLAR